MVFRPEEAPRTRAEFMNWYHLQTQWTEGHSYNDPVVTSDNLRSWFLEMIETFPAMNGPYAAEDLDDDSVTDYYIGKDVIYVTFAWSIAEKAYVVMKNAAEKHWVGFFDASANDGDILFPDNNGMHSPIDRPDNESSIQQIKKSAGPGHEDSSVKEIVYNKLRKHILSDMADSAIISKADKKESWWRKLFDSGDMC